MLKFCVIVLIVVSLFNVMPGAVRGEAAQTVKIGAIFAQTGNAAPSNLLHLQGARFAVEELNARGGVLGTPLELLEFDNASTEIGSVRAAERAIASGVSAVIGASWSSHSLAMAPVLQAAKIPMISPLSTHPELTGVGDYIFRVCFTDEFQGTVMAKFAFHDLHARNAAVLTNTGNQYSVQLAAVFIAQFRKHGGTILLEADYLQEATDFTPHIEQILALQPDVVFVPGYERDSAYIIMQARGMGIEIPFLGGDGWGLLMYNDNYAGARASGNYCSSHWHQDNPSPANQAFVQSYLATHAAIESGGIPLAYDAVMLLADAIRRANSFDPGQIREALAATHNFEGATGRITFDANRNPAKAAVILKLNNGVLEFVKTIDP